MHMHRALPQALAVGGLTILTGRSAFAGSVSLLTANTLPPWIVGADGQSLQTRIAALESAAQLALLLGRCAHSTFPSRCTLRLHPLCDNMQTAAAARKSHSMSEPLCFVLQAVGFHSSRLGVSLDPYHVAGHGNMWAEQLS